MKNLSETNKYQTLMKELNYEGFERKILSLENKIETFKDNLYYIPNIHEFIINVIYEEPDYYTDYLSGDLHSYATNKKVSKLEKCELDLISSKIGFELFNSQDVNLSHLENFEQLIIAGQQFENNMFYIKNEKAIHYNIILKEIMNKNLDVDLDVVDNAISKVVQNQDVIYNKTFTDVIEETLALISYMKIMSK